MKKAKSQIVVFGNVLKSVVPLTHRNQIIIV